MTEISVVHRPERLRFEAMSGDDVAGYVSYEEREGGKVLDLQHTVVAPSRRGQGLGGQMLGGVLDQVRQAGLRIIPTCPFIPSYLEQHPEHADLVADAAPQADEPEDEQTEDPEAGGE